MATRYSDVDLMILKRWDDVKALRQAFDEVLERMQDVVEIALQKTSTLLSDRDLASEFDVKAATLDVWKRDWDGRKKEPGLYFRLCDFVPSDYGRSIREHPSMWLITDEFSRLKKQESSEDFAKATRTALPQDLLTKWNDEEVDLSDSPLGHSCTEVSEADRVQMMRDPDALVRFLLARVDECLELVPAIEDTLRKMTPR